LNSLDGVQSKQGLVTFITTNYFLKLDPAFCRPGRIDYVLEFSYATKSQIYTMLKKFFPQQSHHYDAFYQQVRSLKMSTCILQKYFFECYSDQDILTRIDNLKKDIQLCVFEKDDKMYL
jgi:SpoVK/Ycf46/Vps4 family AAA+-type ATPase